MSNKPEQFFIPNQRSFQHSSGFLSALWQQMSEFESLQRKLALHLSYKSLILIQNEKRLLIRPILQPGKVDASKWVRNWETEETPRASCLAVC